MGSMHQTLRQLASRFASDEGQAMFEYSILVLVIALVVLGAAALFGQNLVSLFSQIVGVF